MRTMIPLMLQLIRKFVYNSTYFIDKTLNRKNKVMILCYHSIAQNNWRYSVSLDEFKKQMGYLEKQYQFITLKDVEEYIKGQKIIHQPSVVITFDDGYKDLLTIKEYVKEHNIRPTLFVLSDQEHANRKEMDNDLAFLTADELQSLADNGWIIGSHSGTHADFFQLNDSDREKEITAAKQNFDYFSYPKGRYTPAILKQVEKAGYKLAVSMDDGVIDTKTNLFAVPRVGVDKTHTFDQFRGTITPSAIAFRMLIKKFIPGGIVV